MHLISHPAVLALSMCGWNVHQHHSQNYLKLNAICYAHIVYLCHLIQFLIICFSNFLIGTRKQRKLKQVVRKNVLSKKIENIIGPKYNILESVCTV